MKIVRPLNVTNTILLSTNVPEYTPGSWSVAASLGTARRTLGGAGTVTAALSFGGFDTADSAVSEEYDGLTWATGGALATARQALGGCGTQTAGLSFGGLIGAANSAVTEEYNGTAWTLGGALATARQYIGSAGTQTAGLGFGGYIAANSALTEGYDGAAWSAGGNLITARQSLGGAGTQTAGLGFGGSSTGISAATEEYDGAIWTVGGSLATARWGIAGAGSQGAALSFGGYTGAYSAVTEKYDGSVWGAGGALITARRTLAGAGDQLAALSFGGHTGVVVAATEKYDTAFVEYPAWSPDAWNIGGALATARSHLAGCGTQTAGLSFGGYTGVDSAVTEEYNGVVWSAGGALATARNALAGAGTQTAGLSFGGGVGAANSAVTEEYNGTAWALGGALATARYGLAGAGTQTAGLSFGGWTTVASAVTEEYNGSSWSTGANLGTARRYLAGAGRVTAALSFGGFISFESAITEEYNGSSWSVGGAMVTASYGLAGGGLQTAAVSFGGNVGINSVLTEAYDGTVWRTGGSMTTARSLLAGAGGETAALSFGGSTGAYSAVTEEYNAYALGDRISLISPSSTISVSIASPAIVTWVGHKLPVGTPISFTTTGTLPTGLATNTTYYIRTLKTADTFTISLTLEGVPVATTGSQSGAHTAIASIHDIYEAVRGGNSERWPITESDWWVKVGPTNRWSMFDTSITGQTSNPDSIVATLRAVGRIDSIVLLNTHAATARFVMTDATDGVVYDVTHPLISDSGITDWYAYFFEPIVYLSELADLNLPSYANATLSLTISNSGGTVLLGACVIGQHRDLGYTQGGMSLGIVGYSVKQQDVFGNYSILERAYSKRSEITFWVRKGMVDELQRLLTAYRAAPLVYIGSEDYESSVIYGFYKDFVTIIETPDYATCSLEIEGLT